MVLIIDTIDFLDSADAKHFRVSLPFNGFKANRDPDRSWPLSLDSFPNYINHLLVEFDSSTLRLSIDTSNGYLEIHNVFGHDTIRIKRLRFYSNCCNDTSLALTNYYRLIGDSVDWDANRVRRKRQIIKKPCERRPPAETQLTINGDDYLVQIKQRKSGFMKITNAHGYIPRGYPKRQKNIWGRAAIFNYHQILVNYINVMSLSLP